jgi:hypothetical protein
MRITARLEPNTAQQLEYLVVRLGASTSDVLRKGIDALYKQHAKPEEPVLKYFSKHIGAYDLGDANLSVNYKQAYAQALNKKFPLSSSKPSKAAVSKKPRK